MSVNEYRVFGPPGTGKTTRAKRDIEQAVDKHGSDGVLVCSFTRAAAINIASRDLTVDRDNVGTLHAICHRKLQRPALAELHAHEFNEKHPDMAVSVKTGKSAIDDGMDAPTSQHSGDQWHADYQIKRAKMIPKELWPIQTQRFAKFWHDWKVKQNYLDFTDLIENSLEYIKTAPGEPRVMFIDEAQDFNALQFALVRQWAEEMEFVVFYGDDDQAIFTFSGASADNLLGEGCSDENKIYLKQSYRLPRAVHEHASTWITQCSRREEKEFKPRKEEGLVRAMSKTVTYKNPDRVINEIEDNLDAGRTVMVLATCGYMLQGTCTLLKEQGIPFHNPYRKTNGAWNPLRRSEGSTLNRLAAFLGTDHMFPTWTAEQLNLWVPLVKSDGILKRGAKTQIKELAEADPHRKLGTQDWMMFFERDPWGFEPISLEWLQENAVGSKADSLAYPARVIERYGSEALDQPAVTVGTIHSVKGGEADVVYLFPDMSPKAMREYVRSVEGRDAAIRAFYVGMTRARQELVLPRPSSPLSVNLGGS